MKISDKLIYIASLLGAMQIAQAVETSPVIELGSMMKKMYSYSVNEFEYGRSPITHKYDAIGNCALLRTFFDVSMLNTSHDLAKCTFDHSRFAPALDGTPVEDAVTADGGNSPPPVPFIQSIKVNEGTAQIDILFGDAGNGKRRLPNVSENKGRVIFFLRKSPAGWLIVNKLSFKVWPLPLNAENSDCRMASAEYQFALEPHAAELVPLPAACQMLERSHLH
jgi:hypothetical protein